MADPQKGERGRTGAKGDKGDRGRKGEQGEDAPIVELRDLLRTERRRWHIRFALLALIVAVLGWLVVDAANARERNCDIVAEALDAYTAGLLRASDDPEHPRTPAEQKDTDRRVQLLRDTYEPVLAECG